MYVVEDETLERARSILALLAAELAEQEASRYGRPVDLRKLIRRSGGADLPAGSEGEHLSSIREGLEKKLPV